MLLTMRLIIINFGPRTTLKLKIYISLTKKANRLRANITRATVSHSSTSKKYGWSINGSCAHLINWSNILSEVGFCRINWDPWVTKSKARAHSGRLLELF